MDGFIAGIRGIYDFINALDTSDEIIDSKISHKQYIAYYLYRIICKYRNLIAPIVGGDVIRTKVFDVLGVPKNFNSGCYALAGHMANNDSAEDTADIAISNMCDILETYEKKKVGLADTTTADYLDFTEFIEFKNAKDASGELHAVEAITTDIRLLHRYLPTLVKSAEIRGMTKLLNKTAKRNDMNLTNESNESDNTNV